MFFASAIYCTWAKRIGGLLHPIEGFRMHVFIFWEFEKELQDWDLWNGGWNHFFPPVWKSSWKAKLMCCNIKKDNVEHQPRTFVFNCKKSNKQLHSFDYKLVDLLGMCIELDHWTRNVQLNWCLFFVTLPLEGTRVCLKFVMLAAVLSNL